MTELSRLWKDQTTGFSIVQKGIVAIIISFILFTAISALVLVYLELTK